MRRRWPLALLFVGMLGCASAADLAGRFNYWMLSLSWSPEYCSSNIGDEECREHRGFVVHGLWPEYERGHPTSCGDRSRVPVPLRARMLPLMPSEKLIQHEWNVHGSCSGLDQQAYFELIERLRRRLEIPAAYEAADDTVNTSRDALLASFRSTNPQFDEEDFALRCRGHWLREVRVCFDTALNPRACAADVEDNCRAKLRLRAWR